MNLSWSPSLGKRVHNTLKRRKGPTVSVLTSSLDAKRFEFKLTEFQSSQGSPCAPNPSTPKRFR